MPRRTAFLALLSTALLVAGAWLLTGPVLERISRRAVQALISEARQRGFILDQVSFENVFFAAPLGAVWTEPRAVLELPGDAYLRFDSAIFLSAESASLRSAGLRDGSWELSLHNAEFRLGDGDQPETIRGERLQLLVPAGWSDPQAALRRFAADLAGLVRTGRTSASIAFDGTGWFSLGNGLHEVSLRTEKIGGETALVLDRTDVRRMTLSYERYLTEAEVDVLANHPFQAMALLRLKEYAERRARAVHLRDRSVSEDAYRHLLWSYLLTRRFGPEFAQQVTDAHEIGAPDNTAAERRMDEHNNALGREYARRGVSEPEILDLYRTDPRVMRVPQ